MMVEGLGLFLGDIEVFAVQVTEGEGEGFALIGGIEIALIILLCGAAVALIGVFNRASLVSGIATIVAAGLSLVVVVFGAVEGDVGSLFLLTGLASLVAGLAGFNVVRQTRKG